MHELSIAMGIVEAATEEAQKRGVQVSAVHLRLGALSGVVKDALLFSYEVACQDTALQGSADRGGCSGHRVLLAMPEGTNAGVGAIVSLSGMRYSDDGHS